MTKKSLFYVISFLVVALFFTNAPLADAERIIPNNPPPIGSVVVTGSSGWQTNVRISNLEKMGISDWVYFQLKDGSGRPYRTGPNSFYVMRDGSPLFLQPKITFDVRAGNSKVLSEYGYVLSDSVKSIYGMPAANIRNQSGGNYLANPLIPGPVYLASVKIEWTDGEVVLAQQSASPNLKLFTVSEPPRLDSVDKNGLKFGETVAVSGANFDVFGTELAGIKIINTGLSDTNPKSYLNRGANIIIVDMDPSGNVDMEIGNFTRSLNFAWEDILHYCNSGRLKFEMPLNKMIGPKVPPVGLWKWAPMPLGTHNIRVINDFGVSNAVTINVSGGQGEKEFDSSCEIPAGEISYISPTSGPVGTEVIIRGTGFTGVADSRGVIGPFNLVQFNGVTVAGITDFVYTRPYPGAKTTNRGTSMKVKVPPGATTGPVTVLPGWGGNTIRGPVFTITAGLATPTPTPTPTSTSGTVITGGGIQATSIFPNRLNIGSDNAVLIGGTGFTSPRLSANNAAVTFSNVEVNEGGTSIRAVAKVAQTNPGEIQLTVTDSGESSGLDAALVIRSADAPQLSSATVSEIDFKFEAEMTISGQNLTNPVSVEVAGIQAAVQSFYSTSPNQVKAKLVFSELFSDVSDPRWSWVKAALALSPGANGVGKICTEKGCDSLAVNAPKLAGVTIPEGAVAPGSSVSYSNFQWGIENPFKAKIDNVMDLLAVLAKFIFQLGIPVAVIIIIYSGIMFLISGDNPGRVKKATDGLKWAAIGLAILLIGKGFVSLIQSILSIK